MIRAIITILLIPMLGFSQIAANLYFDPYPSPYISDWETKMDMAALSITNNRADPLDLKLHAVICTADGREIARGWSLPLTVLPGLTEEIASDQFIDWGSVTYDRSLQSQAISTGRLPEDIYAFCIGIYTADTQELLDEVEAEFNILSFGQPSLISPEDGSILEILQQPFEWTPITDFSEFETSYWFRIYEVLPGQNPMDAIASNMAFHEEELFNQTMFLYPIDAQEFEKGKQYLWYVQATDGAGKSIGENEGRSELWTFSFETSSDPQEIFQELVKLPLQEGLAYLTDLGELEVLANNGTFVLNGEAGLVFESLPGLPQIRVMLERFMIDSDDLERPQILDGRLIAPVTSEDLNLNFASVPFDFSSLNYDLTTGFALTGQLTHDCASGALFDQKFEILEDGINGEASTVASPAAVECRLGEAPFEIQIMQHSVRFPGPEMSLTVKHFIQGEDIQTDAFDVPVESNGSFSSQLAYAAGETWTLTANPQILTLQLNEIAGRYTGDLTEGSLNYDLTLTGRTELALDNGFSCSARVTLILTPDEIQLADLQSECDLGFVEINPIELLKGLETVPTFSNLYAELGEGIWEAYVEQLQPRLEQLAETGSSSENQEPIQLVNDPMLPEAIEDDYYAYIFPDDTFNKLDEFGDWTWELLSTPEWLEFSQDEKRLSGTPVNENVGQNSLLLSVTDEMNESVELTLELLVANVNDAPEVTGTPDDLEVVAGEVFNYSLPIDLFVDPDAGDAIEIEALLPDGTPLPVWLTFDGSEFSGTPPEQIESCAVAVIARDIDGAQAVCQFSINVTSLSDDAVLASALGTFTAGAGNANGVGSIDIPPEFENIMRALSSGESIEASIQNLNLSPDVANRFLQILTDGINSGLSLETAFQAAIAGLAGAETVPEQDVNTDLLTALASGENIESLITENLPETVGDNAGLGLSDSLMEELQESLGTGSTIDEALASAGVAIRSQIETQNSNQTQMSEADQLLSALSNGSDISGVLESILGNLSPEALQSVTESFISLIANGNSMETTLAAVRQSLAVDAAIESSAGLSAVNASVTIPSPADQLLAALATGENVDQALTEMNPISDNSEAVLFQQSLSQALASGESVSEAVVAASESSAGLSVPNASVTIPSPADQLLAALATGENVDQVLTEMNVNVQAVNDAPILTAPDKINLCYEGETVITELSVLDVDAESIILMINSPTFPVAFCASGLAELQYQPAAETFGHIATLRGPVEQVNQALARGLKIKKGSTENAAGILSIAVNDMGQPPRFCTSQVPIEVNMQEVPAPRLLSAQLSDDLTKISISLDRRSYFTKAMISSSEIFSAETSNKLGIGAMVIAGSEAGLTVFLGQGASLKPGDAVLIKEGVLKGAPGALASGEQRADLQGPTNMSKPVAQLRGPNEINPCTDLQLIATVQNTAGRPVTYHWAIQGVAESIIPDVLHNFVENHDQPMLTIAHSLLPPGMAYSFSLTVETFLGVKSDEVIQLVRKSESPRLNIVALGPTTLNIKSNQVVGLFTKSQVPECFSGTGRQIQYNWEVNPTGLTELDLGNPESPFLRIPANTLEGGSQYTVTCRAFMADDPEMNGRVTFSINVERSPLAAIITGGASRRLTTEKVKQLDASLSFDPDLKDAPAGHLTYGWNMIDLATMQTSVNPETGQPIQFEATSSFTLEPGCLSVGQHRVNLQVSTQDGRIAETTQILQIVSGQPIQVSIISPGNQTILDRGSVRLAAQIVNTQMDESQIRYQWSLVGGNLDITSLNPSSLTAASLILNADKKPVWESGQTYQLRVTVSAPGFESGFAETRFQVSRPPAGMDLVIESPDTISTPFFKVSTEIRGAYSPSGQDPLQYAIKLDDAYLKEYDRQTVSEVDLFLKTNDSGRHTVTLVGCCRDAQGGSSECSKSFDVYLQLTQVYSTSNKEPNALASRHATFLSSPGMKLVP